MVIKITKKTDKGNRIEYKSSKFILTPEDIKKANDFDLNLKKNIENMEKFLVKKGALVSRNKKNSLFVWHTVGKKIEDFMKINRIDKNEEKYFWVQFYNYSNLINKRSKYKTSLSRNDFKSAVLLSKFPLKILKKVGPWSMWRDILIYKVLINDKRLMKYVVDYLTKNKKTVHGSRPFLKAINERFKKMETTLLPDNILSKKIKEIKIN